MRPSSCSEKTTAFNTRLSGPWAKFEILWSLAAFPLRARQNPLRAKFWALSDRPTEFILPANPVWRRWSRCADERALFSKPDPHGHIFHRAEDGFFRDLRTAQPSTSAIRIRTCEEAERRQFPLLSVSQARWSGWLLHRDWAG